MPLEMMNLMSGLRTVADVISPKSGSKKSDPSNLIILFAAVVCAFAPLDISQLSFAVLGAFFYMLLQKYDKASVAKRTPPMMVSQRLANASQLPSLHGQPTSVPKANGQFLGGQSLGKVVGKTPPSNESRKQPSIAPIAAPNFNSKDWEGEVAELIGQLLPSPESEATVRRITQAVGKTLRRVIPEIEVSACAGANLFCGRAFGVAVPEVEIVASVKPQILFSRLHGGKSQPVSFDEYKLQKSAIRTCTDRLVADGLKFRRSKFRGSEPKVTLLVPADLGLSTESVAVDFSVNVVTPLYNAALLTECGQMDCRARELILLVKRWAKDRGICHAAKGYFSPYVWGLLCIYFLQVGIEDGPLLPSLDQFAMSSGLQQKKESAKESQQKWKGSGSNKSTACLFKEFFHFYSASFNWQKESVTICTGSRGPPAQDLPVHILATARPAIEDTIVTGQNPGDCLTAETFQHLLEEFVRADRLCEESSSLSQLLEPWTPPETPEVVLEKEVPVVRSGVTSELPPWRRAAAEAKMVQKA